MASLISGATDAWARLVRVFDTSPLLRTAALASALPALYLLHALYSDYASWHALGPGGVSHTPLGYLLQAALRLTLARPDTRSLQPYLDVRLVSHYQRTAQSRYLRDLPARRGVPPAVPGYVAPQRQTDQLGGTGVRVATTDALAALARANPALVALRPSRLEGGRGPALWLADGRASPPFAKMLRGEIAHVHDAADGSGHAVLAPRDAREVLAKGWGERHALSGAASMPVGYTMLYAPRDTDEVAVFVEILRAAVRCMVLDAELQ